MKTARRFYFSNRYPLHYTHVFFSSQINASNILRLNRIKYLISKYFVCFSGSSRHCITLHYKFQERFYIAIVYPMLSGDHFPILLTFYIATFRPPYFLKERRNSRRWKHWYFCQRPSFYFTKISTSLAMCKTLSNFSKSCSDFNQFIFLHSSPVPIILNCAEEMCPSSKVSEELGIRCGTRATID